jgi:hypothetical protein
MPGMQYETPVHATGWAPWLMGYGGRPYITSLRGGRTTSPLTAGARKKSRLEKCSGTETCRECRTRGEGLISLAADREKNGPFRLIVRPYPVVRGSWQACLTE